MNWSYSKGDTMESACVILTENLDGIICDSFNNDSMKPITKNKLYVALTRSKWN